METGHRYRLLLYFAALVLCLSVCFAYAEEPASTGTPASSRLLYYSAPGHASFLPSLSDSLVITPAATPTTTADETLRSLTVQTNHSHHLLRSLFSSKHQPKLIVSHAPEHWSAAASSSPQMAPNAEGDEQASQ
jgi:hypothetical protein